MTDQETGTALTPQETFQEKVKNRLAKDIGDLIPDEILQKMVRESLEELFFKRDAHNKGSTWSPKWIEEPSWFELAVFNEMKQRTLDEVTAYFKENGPTIRTQIKTAVSDYIPNLVADAIIKGFADGASEAFGSVFATFRDKMVNDIRNGYLS